MTKCPEDIGFDYLEDDQIGGLGGLEGHAKIALEMILSSIKKSVKEDIQPIADFFKKSIKKIIRHE